MSKRVVIFIEGKSFHRGYLTFASDAMINFPRMAHWLADYVGGELYGAHYYTALDESEGRLRDFLNMVASKEGYFVHDSPRHYQPSSCQGCKEKLFVQTDKFVDIALSTDIVHLASINAFDVAIFLTNDPAHARILSVVQMMGRQAWVGNWDKVCQELQQVSFGSIILKNAVHRFSSEKRRLNDRDNAQDNAPSDDDDESDDDTPEDDDNVEDVPEFPEEEYIPTKK
jgi:hypothetical protein